MTSYISYLFLGFFTGLSLILAIGPQNIFVIEQGLKKKYIFTVCLICSISDTLLIFLGILIFNFLIKYFSNIIEIILNILLLIFLLNFVWKKLKEKIEDVNFTNKNSNDSFQAVIMKTLGFTYLNPHVYSDTLFFLGNFSRNFYFEQKFFFALGASFASLIFFFALGYMAKYFSKYLQTNKTWRVLNRIIILFMSFIIFIVFYDLITSF